MAETTYYVDTDATDPSPDGSSWAKAYHTLNDAEQARDADITGGNAVVFSCRGTAEDTTAVAITGWTTDSDSYVKVMTETANRHDGKWNTGKYRLNVSSASVMQILEDYVRIDGLQLRKSASSGNDQAPISISGITATNNLILISNGLLIQDGDNNYRQPCLFVNDVDANCVVWNCIAYGGGNLNSTANACIYSISASGFAIYGCTCIGNLYGIRVGSSTTAVAKNCYFYGSTSAVSLGTSATLTATNCATNDTSLSGTEDHDNVACDNDTFVDATNADLGLRNYALAADGLSPLVGHGATLTDDPPGSTALGVDIIGTTRS